MKISQKRLKEIIFEELGKLREGPEDVPERPPAAAATQGISTTALRDAFRAWALDASTAGKMSPQERETLVFLNKKLIDAFDEPGQQQVGRLNVVLTMFIRILDEFNAQTAEPGKPATKPASEEAELFRKRATAAATEDARKRASSLARPAQATMPGGLPPDDVKFPVAQENKQRQKRRKIK